MPYPSPPVLVVVKRPRLSVPTREKQAFADAGRNQVVAQVPSYRVEQVDRPRVEAAHLLAAHDLAIDIALLDQEGVAPHVSDLECEQLLRDAQPLVGDE